MLVFNESAQITIEYDILANTTRVDSNSELTGKSKPNKSSSAALHVEPNSAESNIAINANVAAQDNHSKQTSNNNDAHICMPSSLTNKITILNNIATSALCATATNANTANIIRPKIAAENSQTATISSLTAASNIQANKLASSNSDNLNAIINIAIVQRRCPQLKRFFDYLEAGILPDNDQLARKTRFEAESYFIRDNVLFHIYAPRNLNLDTPRHCHEQVVVPLEMRNQILRAFHDELAHPGFERGYATIRTRYYWPTIYNDVKDYALSCDTCQRNKRQYHAIRAPLCPLPIGDIFSRIHIDIIGILPESGPTQIPTVNTGAPYRYVLLVVDSFSKWIEAYPLRTQTSLEIAEVLFREYFSRYGYPNQINSDRGANLISRIMQHLCKRCNIKRVVTSAYHQSANSAAERQVATLTAAIRCYIDNQHQWYEALPSVLQAFRATVCTQSTEFSPFEICFGRIMRTATDVMLAPATGYADVDAYIQDLIPRLELIRDIASDNSDQHQQIYKQIYDRNTADITLREGTKHWLYMPEAKKGVNKKLRELYSGPVYITQQCSDTNYTVRDVKTNKPLAYSVHRSRLKPCNNYRDTYEYNELTQFDFDDDTDLLSQEVPQYEQIQDELVDLTQTGTNAASDSIPQNDDDENVEEQNLNVDVPPTGAIQKDAEEQEDSFLKHTQNYDVEQTKQQNTTKPVMHQAKELTGVKTQNKVKYFRVKWADEQMKQVWVDAQNIPDRLKQMFYIKHNQQGKIRKSYKNRNTKQAK